MIFYLCMSLVWNLFRFFAFGLVLFSFCGFIALFIGAMAVMLVYCFVREMHEKRSERKVY